MAEVFIAMNAKRDKLYAIDGGVMTGAELLDHLAAAQALRVASPERRHE